MKIKTIGCLVVCALAVLCVAPCSAKRSSIKDRIDAQQEQINLLLQQVSDLTTEVMSLKPRATTTTASLGAGEIHLVAPSSTSVIIIRTGNLSIPKTVRYRTVPITSTPSVDYTVLDGITTLPAGVHTHIPQDFIFINKSATGAGTRFMIQIYDPESGLALDEFSSKVVNIY